jgi:hypothetical protein
MNNKILNFKDFMSYSTLDLKTSQELINSYINEVRSVSYETSRMTEIINDEIQFYLKKKDNILTERDIEIDGYKFNRFKFKTNPTILMFGKECELQLNFIDITTNMSNDDLKVITRKYTNAATKRKEQDYSGDLAEYIDIAYTLVATIVLYKNKMSLYSKSALSHELRHCFVYLKSRTDKTVLDELEKTKRNTHWNKVYDYCENYLKDCDENHFKYGKEFYRIIYALYSCDIEELDAFVQQSYDYVKSLNCESKERIKDELKQTDLWNMINNLKDAIEILEKNDYKEKFNSLRNFKDNKILPTASEIYSLIKKTYKSAYIRFGKVLMTLIDEFNEDLLDEEHLNIDVDWFYILNRRIDFDEYKI